VLVADIGRMRSGLCICYSPLIALSDNAFLKCVAFVLRAADLAPANSADETVLRFTRRKPLPAACYRLFYACYQAACYSR
jgi:hypothetical protein